MSILLGCNNFRFARIFCSIASRCAGFAQGRAGGAEAEPAQEARACGGPRRGRRGRRRRRGGPEGGDRRAAPRGRIGCRGGGTGENAAELAEKLGQLQRFIHPWMHTPVCFYACKGVCIQGCILYSYIPT